MIDDENDHDDAAADDYDGCHDDGEDLIGPEEEEDDDNVQDDDVDGVGAGNVDDDYTRLTSGS